MKHPNRSRKFFIVVCFCYLVVCPFFLQSLNGQERTIKEIFLEQSGLWEGPFQNYVNRDGGIIQKGKIQVEIKYEADRIIKMRNKFLDERNRQSDYTGYSYMKINGHRVEYIGEESIDENTKNKIENHVFKGYLLDKHFYIHEEYTEVSQDGKKEARESSVHYILLNEKEILQIADVYVDKELLVFASTILKKK